MDHKKEKMRGKALTLAVLPTLALLSALNIKILLAPTKAFVQGENSLEDFVDDVQEGYTSDRFIPKSSFIDLNGLLAKATGRRVLNNVVRLQNGMLDRVITDVDVSALAENIAAFSDYLVQNGDTQFLYVQMPNKNSLEGIDLPEGVVSYGNTMSDNLLSALDAAGVNVFDLRPLLCQTPEMLEEYFYRTDHHWNSDGAFTAFQALLERLNTQFPEKDIDLSYAQQEQWERHELENWFLGSLGKRVGQFFGGTDTLIWYTPRFETEMSCTIPKRGEFYQGDFSMANIQQKYIEGKDYFNDNPYCIYIGGDYPLVQHRNLSAPSPLKILMIKDSFTLPLQAYFSTIFQEIDVIDPRHFSECSIAEYVEWTKPDLVLFAINPSVMSNAKYQNFGVIKEESTIADEVNSEIVFSKDIEVTATDSAYNYAAQPVEADTIYRISFDAVDILEGSTGAVGLRVYDRGKKSVVACTIFDLTYCESKNCFTWTFHTPKTEGDLQLLFYAGVYGFTNGKSVVYRNVTLEKCN